MREALSSSVIPSEPRAEINKVHGDGESPLRAI
jgi:hypothetical protein